MSKRSTIDVGVVERRRAAYESARDAWERAKERAKEARAKERQARQNLWAALSGQGELFG